MQREIEYAKDIIVGVRHEGRWAWYVSPIEYWFLDYRKWGALFGESGAEADNAQSRFDITVVDHRTAAQFLDHMKSYQASTGELRRLLQERRSEAPDEYVEYLPSLLVDFDRRTVKSSYYEPVYPEQYVPDGWSGTYETFLEEVPPTDQYWK